jgi:hypothetical protein
MAAPIAKPRIPASAMGRHESVRAVLFEEASGDTIGAAVVADIFTDDKGTLIGHCFMECLLERFTDC